MNRKLLTWLMASIAAAPLFAGPHADNVKDLGDSARASSAYENIAKAGDEAFEDLLEGLGQNPDEDGVSATVKAERSSRRLACARLIGGLRDTRASAKLLELMNANAIETSAYPELAGACAASLGRLWADKPASADRSAVVDALKAVATNDKLLKQIRWGALHGLAHLKAGADVAAPMIGADGEAALREAAIDVVVAARHTASADVLLDLWETQRLGPKGPDGTRTGAQAADYVKTLGVHALFALAALDDVRSVAGLVDVATLANFAGHPTWREAAQKQLKRDTLRAKAIEALAAVFKDDEKPTQHRDAAVALGECGADGVAAFLAISDTPVPEGKPENHFKERVERNLRSLSSESALKAFVEAYGKIAADSKDLRGRVIDHLLNNRTVLKKEGIELFRTAADDATLDAPKRAQCINAFSEIRGKDSFADLERWIKSEDGVIRAQAVQNMGRSYIALNKSKPLLVEAMKSVGDDFAKARENALQGLQRSDDKELKQLFIDALDPAKETSALVRNAALRAIDTWRRNAKVADDEVFPAIKARSQDTDADVRGTAIRIAVTFAIRMGESKTAADLVHAGLADASKEVRLQAYGQVAMVGKDVDAAKLIDAAMSETDLQTKGEAVLALSRIDTFADKTKHEKIADLALSVLDQPGRDAAAIELLGRLIKSDGGPFTYVSDKARAQIDTYTTGAEQRYDKVPSLVRLLIRIEDNVFFKRIEELAKLPNVELRRACVDYIVAFGTKEDANFLRTLRDMTDATAQQVAGHIDDGIRKLQDR